MSMKKWPDCDRAIITYVPVVHRGLLDFFCSQESPILILGEKFLAEFPQLQHDLRAISPVEAMTMLSGFGFLTQIIDPDDLAEFLSLNNSVKFVLPKDEVMISFAEKYLGDREVEFISVFVRWHKKNATSETAVSADRTISHSERDRELIGACAELAQLSSDWWRQVGAMAVKHGEILVTAINCHKPTDFSPYVDGDIRVCFGFGELVEICGAIHAEASLVAKAASKGIALYDCDLYVTDFPCPACAKLIAGIGFRRLFYRDGYSVCDGAKNLRDAEVEIIKVE